MSVQNNIAGSESVVLERPAAGGVYASLFEKINLNPVSELSALDLWQDAQAMSDATADERLTAGMQVFLECLTKAGAKVEKLDKSLIDHHIAELDYQISRQLDAVMHHDEFQAVESLWRGVKSLIDKTDFRQNVKIELLSMSKEDLRQDFEDTPEIIQSGLYKHTYIDEYDTPGGEPIAALISAYEFDASAQDVALLRNISKVSAAAHMPFIGSAGPKFFLKESMEDVAAIKDIGNYFDRAEYIKWKSFRDTDDVRYIGLVMPRVLGRLPYGPDTVPVRSFNYVEEVKGPDHDKYLWTNASFAFASNMVRSFINNGWCVQIRGPQAGGAVQDLPIHLYDLGTGNQVKIPSEVMIPETREFEFANLGFIPLSYYKNRDYACFFSANSTQKPALYDTADATAIQSQKMLTDALTELAQPGMVLNAPQGVSISSPEGVRVSSGSASVGIVAQNNVDISVMKRFTVAAGEAISMLARQAGMKLFAAKGKVEIQAQDDALEAIAKKDITVTSAEGKIKITAATELVVNCGGAYIKLSNGNIELGCPGNILLKCANVQKMGAASLNTPAPEFPKGYGGIYSLTDEEGKIIAHTEYKVTTADGQVFHGISDDNGKTLPIYTSMPGKLKIEILGTGNSATGSEEA